MVFRRPLSRPRPFRRPRPTDPASITSLPHLDRPRHMEVAQVVNPRSGHPHHMAAARVARPHSDPRPRQPLHFMVGPWTRSNHPHLDLPPLTEAVLAAILVLHLATFRPQDKSTHFWALSLAQEIMATTPLWTSRTSTPPCPRILPMSYGLP